MLSDTTRCQSRLRGRPHFARGRQCSVMDGGGVAVPDLAAALVGAGRFVPGLTVDEDGLARSWWWPLPAADDRDALRALLPDATPEAHHLPGRRGRRGWSTPWCRPAARR